MLTFSVIIPVLNEQERINGLISHLRSLEPGLEVIVVDGDPSGSTVSAVTDTRAVLHTAPRGRGMQLAAGAALASGDILLMLHADTLLPDAAFRSIRDALAQHGAWGAFRLGINAGSLTYRVIERAVDLRCKLFSLPYGDQAIFVTRAALRKVGGVPALPLMEDVELSRRLHTTGFRFVLLTERVITSPRRWQRDGIVRRTLGNWWLLLRYLTGSDPAVLAREYQ
jgi:rSAM/selenodomain-associated transferase 2